MLLHGHLPRTNCGRCLLPSCLAFAAALAAGKKKPAHCPILESENAQRLEEILDRHQPGEPVQAEFLDRLRDKIKRTDLENIAPRIGARYRPPHLVINVLGKDFLIGPDGTVSSECHIISWVTVPLLAYVTNPTHQEISGEWITFRELDGGMEWQGLFTSRCEEPLRRLADTHPHLLQDLMDLFQGTGSTLFAADIALTLHPLPHCPILFCHQAKEDDLDSKLTIFFDRCCGANLHIKPLYTLCAGLIHMFDAIANSHT